MINPPPAPDLLAELAAFRDYVALVAVDDAYNWAYRPSDAEWSLTEIACHLRDVEHEVHQARYRALINGDGAFLPGVDADQWAIPRNYRAQNCPTAFSDFLSARDETIALLATLPPEVWARQGQHTYFGPTSLRELVYLAVQHDRVHRQQIEALIQQQSESEARDQA